jgi:hypothetical protein
MKPSYTALICILAILVLAAHAPAQDTSRRWTPALVLATLTWSEAGLVCPPDDLELHCTDDADMRGIHAVLLRGAEHHDVRYVRFAGLYSPRLIGGRGAVPRAWLRDLRPDGSRPDGWPERVTVREGDRVVSRPHMSWRAASTRWVAHYRAAQAMIENYTLENYAEWGPCTVPPDDWGSPRFDHDRAVRLGLIQLTCEPTSNEFWSRPSRAADSAVPPG